MDSLYLDAKAEIEKLLAGLPPEQREVVQAMLTQEEGGESTEDDADGSVLAAVNEVRNILGEAARGSGADMSELVSAWARIRRQVNELFTSLEVAYEDDGRRRKDSIAFFVRGSLSLVRKLVDFSRMLEEGMSVLTPQAKSRILNIVDDITHSWLWKDWRTTRDEDIPEVFRSIPGRSMLLTIEELIRRPVAGGKISAQPRPLSMDEAVFLGEILLERAQRESRDPSMKAGITPEEIIYWMMFFFPTPDAGVQKAISRVEGSRPKSQISEGDVLCLLDNFVRQMLDGMMDLEDPRHAIAVRLFRFIQDMQQMKDEEAGVSEWALAFSHSLTAWDHFVGHINLIEFIKAMLEIADIRGDEWYREFVEELIAGLRTEKYTYTCNRILVSQELMECVDSEALEAAEAGQAGLSVLLQDDLLKKRLQEGAVVISRAGRSLERISDLFPEGFSLSQFDLRFQRDSGLVEVGMVFGVLPEGFRNPLLYRTSLVIDLRQPEVEQVHLHLLDDEDNHVDLRETILKVVRLCLEQEIEELRPVELEERPASSLPAARIAPGSLGRAKGPFQTPPSNRNKRRGRRVKQGEPEDGTGVHPRFLARVEHGPAGEGIHYELVLDREQVDVCRGANWDQVVQTVQAYNQSGAGRIGVANQRSSTGNIILILRCGKDYRIMAELVEGKQAVVFRVGHRSEIYSRGRGGGYAN